MIHVKFCGIRREEDVEEVNRLQPDFAGFVFAQSRRQVTPEQAARLKNRLKNDIQTVAVLVNMPEEQAAALANNGIADVLQLHGDEDAAYIARLKTLTDAKIIKVIRLQAPHDADGFRDANGKSCAGEQAGRSVSGQQKNGRDFFSEGRQADYYLFDTFVPNIYGGTGKTFSLSLLKNLPIDRPFFLAGGLDADNVADIVAETVADERLRPFFYGVDVSGGIETDGVKDAVKMEAFIRAVRDRM